MEFYDNGNFEKVVQQIENYRKKNYILPARVSYKEGYEQWINENKDSLKSDQERLVRTSQWAEDFTQLRLGPAYYVSLFKGNLSIVNIIDLIDGLRISWKDQPQDSEIDFELWQNHFRALIEADYGSIRSWIKTFYKDFNCTWSHYQNSKSIHVEIEEITYDISYYSKLMTKEDYFSSKSLQYCWDFESKSLKEKFLKGDDGLAKARIIMAGALFRISRSLLFKQASVEMRKELNLDTNLAKWKNEEILYSKLKMAFHEDIVLFQNSPPFLEYQSYDVFFPEKNIAIEYNGIQHYKPVDFFGGLEGFLSTVERDNRKRSLSKKNNIVLIEVQEGFDFEHLLSIIREENWGENSSPFIEIRNPKKELYQLSVDNSLINVSEDDSPKAKTIRNYYDPETIIYDCKTKEEMSFQEFSKSHPNINLSSFYSRQSIYNRFILASSKKNSKLPSGWKTILDISDQSVYRFNKVEFAEFVGVKQNSVWAFFNGKQKVFNRRFKILD